MLREIKEHLLKFGGAGICYPNFDEFLSSEIILKEGQLIDYKNIIFKQGVPLRCHDNVLEIVQKTSAGLLVRLFSLSEYKPVTGYALSPVDNIWHRHSWLIDDSNNIIETTYKWDKYFGVVLTQEQFLLITHGFLKKPVLSEALN